MITKLFSIFPFCALLTTQQVSNSIFLPNALLTLRYASSTKLQNDLSLENIFTSQTKSGNMKAVLGFHNNTPMTIQDELVLPYVSDEVLHNKYILKQALLKDPDYNYGHEKGL